MNKLKSKLGFTLVELVVVLAIIALILSIAVVSYQSANKRARDGRRKADLEQLRAALEMHRADNGKYPPGYFYSSDLGVWANFKSAINTGGRTYISHLPIDPINIPVADVCGDTRGYFYWSENGSTYCLVTALENAYPSDSHYDATCANGNSCAAAFWANYVLGPP